MLSDKAMFTELVQVFNEAWLLLKNQLKNHGKYYYDKLFINVLININIECSEVA